MKMTISKELDFDRYLVKIKAQSQQRAFDILAKETSDLCTASTGAIREVFEKRLSERTFGMGNGLAIFDIKSPAINQPILMISSFDKKLDFNALDGKPVDIMAAVISPYSDVSGHLQRLALISRVLKSQDLLTALRDAETAETMQVLFMPSQGWMVAA